MAIRKALSYSKKVNRPYTRVSKAKSRAYIKVMPPNKVVKYNLGNQRAFEDGRFPFVLRMISEETLVIRDLAIESARMVLTKNLEDKLLGKFYLWVKIYPHHILRNNKDFHVFTTLYIENDKLKRLIPIVLLDKFMSVMAKWDTKTDGKLNNVLFVILEGKIFLPEITIEDYIKIASNIMANRLSTVRASGIGVSTITETQNLFEFSSQCRESMSFKILGKLSSNDLGILSKIEGFNKDTRQRITNLRKGHVMISYEDDSGDIVQEEMSFLQAPYSHADEGADISFIERYSKEYPENLKNFKEEYEYMENLMEEEIKIAEQKAKRIKDKENIDIQKRRLAKVKKEEGKEKSDELKSTIKELKGKEFEDMCIKCYMAYSEGNRDGKKASLNKLAKILQIYLNRFL